MCACPRANRHSWQAFMMCSYLMSWMFISKWFICSVTMGRLVHQVMLPWATEERGWKGTSHQTTELFVQAAFGPWQGSTALSCSTISASRFARREHVSSHTHTILLIVWIFIILSSKLKLWMQSHCNSETFWINKSLLPAKCKILLYNKCNIFKRSKKGSAITNLNIIG